MSQAAMPYSSVGRAYLWYVCFKMGIFGPDFMPASISSGLPFFIPFL